MSEIQTFLCFNNVLWFYCSFWTLFLIKCYTHHTINKPNISQAIPAGISGRDVIGIARTGSGKTAAYVWPMIPHIMDQEELGPGDGPIAIVLAPTRELCIQIHQECRKFTKAFKLRVVCAYGGGNMYEQEKALTSQCEIVVATPVSLIVKLIIIESIINKNFSKRKIVLLPYLCYICLLPLRLWYVFQELHFFNLTFCSPTSNHYLLPLQFPG